MSSISSRLRPTAAALGGLGPSQPVTGLVWRSGSLIAIIFILALLAWRAPLLLSPGNIGLVLAQASIVGTLGFALTLVVAAGGRDLVKGGIDLSLAANLGLSAALYASLLTAGWGDLPALGLTLLAGLGVGLLNALAVTVIGILPLLATLATMSVCAGAELVLTENLTVPASSPFLDWLAGQGPLDFPVMAWALLVLAAILALLLHGTPLGLRLYGVGGNPAAARAAGLRVRFYLALSYVLAGLLAAVAAVLAVAFTSAATPGSDEMLLPLIVTTFLGTVFSSRLRPTIGGTLLSALFVGFLVNGFQLLAISSYWANGIQGFLILVVVATTRKLGPGARR
ncbi:monosaccharide ABC transporter membrane protein, CUT2 family [Arboricoccus pini]|uniref:Monosaccharide ABC transporter membrane protein, CUT2 family n=1 Tax=Arboricoccus pini TaxID=1963835 RepID=A0A212S3S4_9PROT|nr:ABC transporter permease [Arboricoccus pini]SNB79668.1 monosaccharide ABC transporter membrane protein, CUT2 family [Arboricoccus pini]